jgi:hypothetical protein
VWGKGEWSHGGGTSCSGGAVAWGCNGHGWVSCVGGVSSGAAFSGVKDNIFSLPRGVKSGWRSWRNPHVPRYSKGNSSCPKKLLPIVQILWGEGDWDEYSRR